MQIGTNLREDERARCPRLLYNAASMPQASPWNSLEIVKLVVATLTPIAVALLGLYLTRLAKRFEHLQWRNQRLIEKRIAVYDALAHKLK